MERIKVSNSFLVDVQYKFTMPNRELISVTYYDNIVIESINGNGAVLKAKRTLDFGKDTGSYISVSQIVVVESNEALGKTLIETAIREGIAGVNGAFSKASLLISELTFACPIGIIVTPPGYNEKQIDIQ